jgi:hypothetical protein
MDNSEGLKGGVLWVVVHAFAAHQSRSKTQGKTETQGKTDD